MMKYKMIVLDLDGTLTNSKKEMTTRTRETLLAAERKGLRVVLASGRPTYGITALAEELELKDYGGYILAFNGGRITDCATGDVVFDQPLSSSVVEPLRRCEKRGYGDANLPGRGDSSDKESQ